MKTGIELIAEERQRQIEKEGWSSVHDAGHNKDEIAMAAVAYAMPHRKREYMKNGRPKLFPWIRSYWKPTPDNRVRELVKAGALIAAEIDRLQRLTTTP